MLNSVVLVWLSQDDHSSGEVKVIGSDDLSSLSGKVGNWSLSWLIATSLDPILRNLQVYLVTFEGQLLITVFSFLTARFSCGGKWSYSGPDSHRLSSFDFSLTLDMCIPEQWPAAFNLYAVPQSLLLSLLLTGHYRYRSNYEEIIKHSPKVQTSIN